ncbi:hypothetical protein DFH09DRAFT_1096089 [Mycena vulgaris]|nr:hypothetical protein DFH09DRAFT_1096089 [Mycena vulgaris]
MRNVEAKKAISPVIPEEKQEDSTQNLGGTNNGGMTGRLDMSQRRAHMPEDWMSNVGSMEWKARRLDGVAECPKARRNSGNARRLDGIAACPKARRNSGNARRLDGIAACPKAGWNSGNARRLDARGLD